MRIEPVVASVVGMVDSSHWGQVLILPHAYGVLEVESPNALNAGIGLLSTLTKLLSSPPTTLDAVSAVAREISGEHVVSLLLLVPVADVMYVVLSGTGAVYLKRGDTLSLLMAEAGSISGEVKAGDTVILASKGLATAIPKEKLSTVFDHLTPSDVAEKLTILLHEQKEIFGGAALIFQVEKLVAVEEEASLEPFVEETAVAQPVIASGRPFEAQGKPFLSKVRSFRPHHFSSAHRIIRGRLHRGTFSKRAILVAAVILLFVISVVFGLKKQVGSSQAKAVVLAMTNAQRAYDEGVALLPLNTLKAREQLTKARQELEPLQKTVSPKSKEGRSLANLYQQITDAITQSLAVTRGEPQLFYDVSLLKKGAMTSAMSLADGVLTFFDIQGSTVFSMNVNSKNGLVIAGGESFSGGSLISNSSATAYILTANGIAAVAINEKTTKDGVVPKDSEWGNIKSLNAFAGNLYLLDIGKSRIWKYMATDSGFSERREYLNPDTLPDLSKAISVAIDGSIWLGTSDGKMLRFTQGKEQTYVPQGVEPAFGNNLMVATSDETKNVYVLDKEKKRVVVLDKDGLYLAQYVWEGAVTPTAILATEAEKKILLLSDGKIYSIDLK